LLTVIGILLTTTTTAQPRRDNRNGNSGNRLKAMMERFDTNRDGVVTRNEFKGSPERFSMMDSNGDGKVDGAEMTAMQNRMRQSNRQGGNRRGPEVL
ncbi:hypothetical protein, partial [Isoptericola croceus]|uniref:hypothetical protein n=1 Tax=Isoptericola croceus TaxID=3031406 RepID=UPI0023FA1E13